MVLLDTFEQAYLNIVLCTMFRYEYKGIAPLLSIILTLVHAHCPLYRYEYKGTARPLSTIDSGLYSTDSTDSDQEPEKRIEGKGGRTTFV